MSRFFLCFALILSTSFVTSQELINPRDRSGGPTTSPRITPLETPWSKELTAKNVHPEYPRPMMVREHWLNLNGPWELKDGIVPATEPFKETILVPFPVESKLSGVGRPMDAFACRRTFTVPETWPKESRILLHFGAVDWSSMIFVNGRQVGAHLGGYDPFSFDITENLRTDRPNELMVWVFDPTNRGEQPRGKQTQTPSGIWYTSISGIWQTVWLEPVPPESIREIRMSGDIDQGEITVHAEVSKPRKDLSVYVEVFDGDKLVSQAYGGCNGPLLVKIPKESLKLWSPDSPNLYQIRVRLLDKEMPIDRIGTYYGLRKIDLAKDEQGRVRIRLNNKFTFLMGVLDQGYWPDGLYTAPSDQAIQSDLLVAKSLGFNLIRKHVKIEPQRWYYWADRLGMFVWQEMPEAENRTPEAQKQFELELQRMVQSLANHPSIIIWTLFNEGWGQHRTSELVEKVRQLDPTRLVNAASGWKDFGVGQLIDQHKFPGPESPTADGKRALVIGSFGGLTLVPPKANLWTPETWGYQHVPDSETLLNRYRDMHEELRNLIRKTGLSAAVFHQLIDVESECNGLISFDRKLLKVPSENVRSINKETIDVGAR